jgi:N-methylhydantoinase A
MTIEKFAAGVIRVVNATMEKAIRVVSIERGYDPREFALVAFGGAGGLHACELASALGIPTVIVPAMPGALSAYGILVSDIVKDYSRTVLLRAKNEVPRAKLESEFRKLERKAETEFRAERWEGTPSLVRTADLRYRGQGFELNVPYGPRMLAEFHEEHRRRYGYASPEREVEIVTVRLRARIKGRKTGGARLSKAREALRTGTKATAVLDRDSLQVGKSYRGPVIVTEYSATTMVLAGAKFRVDAAGNLIITLTESQ